MTFWHTDLYTVRLEVHFCFFTLFCSTAFIITQFPETLVFGLVSRRLAPYLKPLISTSKVYSPQEMEIHLIMNLFPYFLKSVPSVGVGGEAAYYSSHFRGRRLKAVLGTSPILHHSVVLLAVTLEKSPIRSLGSLSKMFSMVPFGEDARDKDWWCRICNKPKVENETRLQNKGFFLFKNERLKLVLSL